MTDGRFDLDTVSISTGLIARTGWPSGPWDTEPDRVAWVLTNTSCVARRGPMGAWCGYVAVGYDHPWYLVRYNDPIGPCAEECTDELGYHCHTPADLISVHGGLTYSAVLPGGDTEGSDDQWYFGFDCAHVSDFVPSLAGLRTDGEYRGLGFVIIECDFLARSLREVKGTT